MSIFTPNPEVLAAMRNGEGVLGEAIRHDLEQRAEAVSVQAAKNIEVIIPATSEFDLIGFDIRSDGEGLHAAIGLTGEGKWSIYLGRKAASERDSGTPGDWLKSALEAARD